MPKARWEPDLSRPLPEVRAEIRAVFEGALARAADRLCDEGPFGPAARYSLLAGGKRLRPILVVLAAHAAGPSRAPTDRLLAVALAAEMIHTYSLIHDDLPCMDDDALRRGVSTCHVVFGVEAATWTGGTLLVAAFRLLREGFTDGAHLSAAARILADGAGFRGMVGGQWLDVELPRRGAPAGRFDEVHTRKTAALIAASCRLGGLAGGADDVGLNALWEYGICLGRAFQAVDDLLDTIGDEGTLGKGANKDAAAGKLTAPAALGVEGTRRYLDDLTGRAVEALASLRGPAVVLLRELVVDLSRRTN